MLYFMVFMTLMMMFCSLAVDLGRLRLVKIQAQDAADAAALYAAGGIVGGTPAGVRARAAQAASENQVDGSSVVLNTSTDVVLGVWEPVGRTFTTLTGAQESGANCVKVTVYRTQSRGCQPKLCFAPIVGLPGKDVTATAIATIGSASASNIPAYAAPWLAGMPNGSAIAATGGNPTQATSPANSPVQFTATPGKPIRFAYTTGTTSWNGMNNARSSAAADGDTTWIVTQSPTNGIGSTTGPLNAMVGIFLDSSAPNTTATAAPLDFSTPTSRNFSTLSPQLKQVFYIGDGLDDNGNLQSFYPPSGTARMYIGTLDENGWWWDNTGSIQFIAVQGNSPVLVR
ncbi:MAG: Rhs family protein [Phycisphaerales bacterium]|nr:Rhs family protein [Phycisphaerales bacterium]